MAEQSLEGSVNPRYPYWAWPERPRLRWPNGARLAVWVIPNIEHFRWDRPSADLGYRAPQPDVPTYAERDYGNRIGVWRMMEMLDKHGIRGTVALNAEVCRLYPQIVRAGVERGWDWMGHGITNSRPLAAMDNAEAGETIRTVVESITASTGRPPRGWLGPALSETSETPDLLAEAGIDYVGDWVADEQPFPLRVRSGRLISVPYPRELNDHQAFLNKLRTPEQFCQMICDQFDVLYAEGETTGRVMGIALHPFLIGHPYRAKWLDTALAYLKGHDRVWYATGSEIADWYSEQGYDAAPK